MTVNETIKGWRIPQRVDIPNYIFKIRQIQTGHWFAVAQLSGIFWMQLILLQSSEIQTYALLGAKQFDELTLQSLPNVEKT